jgi:glycine cleavage system regulatory protein
MVRALPAEPLDPAAPVGTLWLMTTLVLTVVGADRAGLVAAVADVVDAHGGNWENSQLAELAGAFAGIIEVSVPTDRVEELRASLSGLEGLLTVSVHASEESAADADDARRFAFRVLGNDHPGIVREISSTLSAHGLSIERMSSETYDAAMAGGRLFEATIAVRVAESVDVDAVQSALESLAAEIQVDVSLES